MITRSLSGPRCIGSPWLLCTTQADAPPNSIDGAERVLMQEVRVIFREI
jgi:hypothetical protein